MKITYFDGKVRKLVNCTYEVFNALETIFFFYILQKNIAKYGTISLAFFG